jgi:hypothetical protein
LIEIQPVASIRFGAGGRIWDLDVGRARVRGTKLQAAHHGGVAHVMVRLVRGVEPLRQDCTRCHVEGMCSSRQSRPEYHGNAGLSDQSLIDQSLHEAISIFSFFFLSFFLFLEMQSASLGSAIPSCDANRDCGDTGDRHRAPAAWWRYTALGLLWLARGLDLCWKALRRLPAPRCSSLSTSPPGPRLCHLPHRRAFIKPSVLYTTP